MFSATPELYDTIYRSLKDYAEEARVVAERLARLAPQACTLLDVACGTGEHALHLQRDHGYQLTGLDLEAAFVAQARAKLPGARFEEGDMADFDLGRRFDVVLCLFSSIAYLRTLGRVERALHRFREHLEPGGVLVVEPWFPPDAWEAGRVDVLSAEADGLRVVRMSHASREGRDSRVVFHYLIGGVHGLRHEVEEHVLGLFTVEEQLDCFRRAGFADVEHEPEGLMGRGLFVARRPD